MISPEGVIQAMLAVGARDVEMPIMPEFHPKGCLMNFQGEFTLRLSKSTLMPSGTLGRSPYLIYGCMHRLVLACSVTRRTVNEYGNYQYTKEQEFKVRRLEDINIGHNGEAPPIDIPLDKLTIGDTQMFKEPHQKWTDPADPNWMNHLY